MALSPGLIPTLDGRRFIEKPPLYYWTLAGAYHLAGGASVLAARAVSVVAGLAILGLMYAWVRRAHSRGAGLTAAFMLATSVQFLVSTHWVLLDPLLMLVTTAAAWAAYELLSAPADDGRLRWALYGALVLALWIKGPIGPLLMAAGLSAYALVDRPAAWRRLRPLIGLGLLLGMGALLAAAIFLTGGRAALWEWIWVNQVQRLLAPGVSGHREPLLYYTWTLPYTLLPWLPALLQALRPRHWRRLDPAGSLIDPARRVDPARYGALMGAGMVLLLSIPATKRETYLLPALPLLFGWLGIRSYEWWRRWCALEQPEGAGSRLWWLQVALLGVYGLSAPLAAWIWQGSPGLPVAAGLAAGLAALGALILLSVRARHDAAGRCALAVATTAGAILLALAGPVLNPTKDMGPFMRTLGQRLPPGQPVYALHADETLQAEVPFYTGRLLRALAPRAPLPGWVLVQADDDRIGHPLPAGYRPVMHQAFGRGRSLTLWYDPAGQPLIGPRN